MQAARSSTPSLVKTRLTAVTAELALLWGMLLLWSFARCPIPAVNEPHYLCKAKFFWDPTFCPRDFFHTSSNPHFFFYLTFGWLTQYLTLSTVAVLVRGVSLAVLACGWRQITLSILNGAGMRVLALSLFLLVMGLGNFSGEWLVGGAESKVMAYGFGFWALGEVFRKRLLLASIFWGMAIAYHPVVGLWILLAYLISTVILLIFDRAGEESRWKQSLVVTIGALICSLPGLIPAIMLFTEPATPVEKFQGDYLQVFHRLKHHLDPMQFSWLSYTCYLLLLGWIFASGRKSFLQTEPDNGDQQFASRLLWGFTISTCLFALAGVLLGLRTGEPIEMYAISLRTKLLKFYPFRLFDLWLPLVAVLVLLIRAIRIHPERISKLYKTGPAALLSAGIVLLGICLPYVDSNPSRMPPNMLADWKNACEWIRTTTDENDLFVTTRKSWAFKWYAQRAEYVNRKDCPQESQGILEWNERLRIKNQWGSQATEDYVVTTDELRELHSLTQADYLIWPSEIEIDAPIAMQNSSFQIVRLRPEDVASPELETPASSSEYFKQ